MIESVSFAAGATKMPSPIESAQSTTGAEASFGQVLKDTAAEAMNDLSKAEATSIAGLQGKAGTREVVDSIMQAERSMQTAIAIRDKLVSAYHELSRMQI